jgi:hypothetical protein
MTFYWDLNRPSSTFTSITFKKVSSGSEKNLQKNPVLALKSPTSAHFMSFSIKFTNSFSIKCVSLLWLYLKSIVIIGN